MASMIKNGAAIRQSHHLSEFLVLLMTKEFRISVVPIILPGMKSPKFRSYQVLANRKQVNMKNTVTLTVPLIFLGNRSDGRYKTAASRNGSKKATFHG